MTTPFAAEHMAAEISRLRVELEKANEQSEHFERQWYLRGDEIEALNAKLGEPQSAGVVMPDMTGALAVALDGLLSIAGDSAGVVGYHLNGNVADWDEFQEVDTARDVMAIYRARLNGKEVGRG